ncbi:MalY/PatB family protein [Buttiauxella ferragutiae]|uniref:cysteine-S-conjugate beta-lyase n=1 Tax=Buttiauxella ferragutiae ATCC 51602 TaxID=1354252 RepID=A0ABX2W718_9ENTR|nr:PatB family C-S lyase [Buttiauxella ferragutiae]OAT26645.1 putative aminotransferase [Buttiauxella ferragutiae ATCC 51602]
MAFNFDEGIDRRHSDSSKWNKFGDEVLPMWVADMDFRSPPCILDALHQRVEHGVFGYGVRPRELIEVVIERMASRYQWQIKPEWIVILPGVVAGLNLSVRAFTSPNESTIAPTPIYPPFRKSSAFAQRPQLNAPLRLENGRWVIDLPSLEPLLTGKEKLLMLCNPQNPGGTVYRRDELQQQLEFAQRHDLIVCSDEIHGDLLLEPDAKHIPFATLSADAEQRSITLLSPSKTFNIAGLGASLAIIPDPQLRKQFNTTRDGIVPSVDVLALTAATAAWRDGESWLQELLPYLRCNRDRLVSAINNMPGLTMATPQATYLGWVDATALPVDNPTLFFQKAGLGFSPGTDFGEAKFVRINFGCTSANLEEAIKRMKAAVQSIR